MPPLPRFSVRSLAWIPVATAEGTERLSLDQVFERAHEISHVEVRDPIVRAAVNRFLISAGVLVARAAGVTVQTAQSFADNGFTAQQVAAAFNPIDDRLWLLHPDTPFAQSAALADTVTATDVPPPVDPAASLFPRTPGGSGQAWFDVADGIYQTPDLSPEDAALALITSWFYSPKSNKSRFTLAELPDEDGTLVETRLKWMALGTVGLAGHRSRGDNNNLTFWHRGATLSEFLLLNTAPHWLSEPSAPAWASDYTTHHTPASLSAHTFSANAALLSFNPATMRFTTVIRGGHPDGVDPRASLARVNEQLRSAAEDDPSRVWRDTVFDKKIVKVLFEGFSATHSTSQNLRAWFVDGARPHLAAGILRSPAGALDVLAIGTKSTTSMPQMRYVTWMSVDGAQLSGDAVADELIAELATSAYAAPEAAILHAINTVFPAAGRPPRRPAVHEACAEHAIRAFHTALEPVFGAAVDTILQGGEPSAFIDELQAAKVAAFDSALRPYLSARLFPDVARGRAKLTRHISPDAARPDSAPDPVAALVGRFIRQVQTDTRFRVDVARGLSPRTEAAAVRRLTGVDALRVDERTGVTRALGLLASHPRLTHDPTRTLSSALAALTLARQETAESTSGVAAKVGLAPFLTLESLTPVVDGLLSRLADANIGLNFYDVVAVLRTWDSVSARRQLAYSYHSALTPTKV